MYERAVISMNIDVSQESSIDQRISSVLRGTRAVRQRGKIVRAIGTSIHVSGVHARIGQQCRIIDRISGESIFAEVVGFSNDQSVLLPLGNLQGIAADAEVEVMQERSTVAFGDPLLGRVVDCFGLAIDENKIEGNLSEQSIYAEAPNPLSRKTINTPFSSGVRAIDALLTVGVGQRVGVFATAGGGKSTLLGMLARQSTADINVIALIGERGREVKEFLEDSLGEDGLRRSVVIVATSDRPAMERVRAAQTATAIAEGFRSQGKHVLLLMDSVTRFARALREIGLSAGESPARRGFPPSVFAELPRLFERTGNDDKGSITAFYTVLSEDEDSTDPIAEEVRSILDGHIILSRSLAQAGHYPAIDVLSSISRIFSRVTDLAHQQAAVHLRALLAKHAEIEFLLQVGEYEKGSDPIADEAIEKLHAINSLLRQHPHETTPLTTTIAQLQDLI